jgi:phage terminase large subunit-like protein
MLQLGLRCGDRPRALVTTTPRPGPVLTRIMADPSTIVTGGPTRANPHLPDAYLESAYALYAGTRLGEQELEGKLLPDVPGALWTVELLASCRAQGSDWGPIARQRVEPASGGQPAPRSGDRTDVTDSLRDGLAQSPFLRIVIGVDPPTGDGTCGIVVCAKDAQGIAHVLADHSVTARSPEGWSRAVADAARIWSHPRPFRGEGGLAEGEPGEGEGAATPVLIVAEQNQGGKMVRAVLHTADPALRVKPVTATVGKNERAAPVAMLFEAGRVVLHGRFPELEAELLGMIAGGGYEGPGNSPDRADAMVWGLTELMLTPERAAPRVRAL